MTVNTKAITEERLKKWAEVLEQDHCTPALLIGIGHGPTSGQMHLIIPENVTPRMALSWLAYAVLEMDKRADNNEGAGYVAFSPAPSCAAECDALEGFAACTDNPEICRHCGAHRANHAPPQSNSL